MTKEEERAVKDELLGEKAEVGWIHLVVNSRNKHKHLILLFKSNSCSQNCRHTTLYNVIMF